jgi:5S rRNA maturation endonuclease (ribonuclease M5)
MSKNAVLELLRSKFSKVKSASGNNYRIPCPTCAPKDRKKMKRYISTAWATSNCFICGRVLKLTELLNVNEFQLEDSSSSVVEDYKELYPYAKQIPFERLEALTQLTADHPALAFLKKDHLTNLDYYGSLGIGYIPVTGGSNITFESGYSINTGDSLYFPVYFNRERVGWQLRFIPGTVNGERLQFMRYLHLFPKGNYLFNYDNAKKFKHVVVVEGVKKALKSANFVATFGKGITDVQKQLIQEWKKITILLDGEDSAQKAAQEIAREFNFNGKICKNVDLREFGFSSPDEMTAEQLKTILNNTWKTT